MICRLVDSTGGFFKITDEVYRQLRETTTKRGRAVDIPEFYEMARTLFTLEEAEIQNATPSDKFNQEVIAEKTG